jgi:hypothetical protein
LTGRNEFERCKQSSVVNEFTQLKKAGIDEGKQTRFFAVKDYSITIYYTYYVFQSMFTVLKMYALQLKVNF